MGQSDATLRWADGGIFWASWHGREETRVNRDEGHVQGVPESRREAEAKKREAEGIIEWVDWESDWEADHIQFRWITGSGGKHDFWASEEQCVQQVRDIEAPDGDEGMSDAGGGVQDTGDGEPQWSQAGVDAFRMIGGPEWRTRSSSLSNNMLSRSGIGGCRGELATASGLRQDQSCTTYQCWRFTSEALWVPS